jgi:hypothetical protein
MRRSFALFIALSLLTSLLVSACGTLEISLATPPPEITDVPVGALVFSPDGRFLLISETDRQTGAHLFVVDVETLEQRIIQTSGLALDIDWVMPSWRR